MQALRLKKKSAFILRLEKHWTNLQGRPERFRLNPEQKKQARIDWVLCFYFPIFILMLFQTSLGIRDSWFDGKHPSPWHCNNHPFCYLFQLCVHLSLRNWQIRRLFLSDFTPERGWSVQCNVRHDFPRRQDIAASLQQFCFCLFQKIKYRNIF